jgi:hypothetical protein
VGTDAALDATAPVAAPFSVEGLLSALPTLVSSVDMNTPAKTFSAPGRLRYTSRKVAIDIQPLLGFGNESD